MMQAPPQAPAPRALSNAWIWAATAILLLAALELTTRALAASQRWTTGWPPFLADCLFLYLHLPVLGAVLVVVEKLRPTGSTGFRRGQAALFWACYVPVAVLAGQIVAAIAAAAPWAPLFKLHFAAADLNGSWAGVLGHAALLLGIVALTDFFYYWFHRLQHTVPALWAFHSTHHAIRSISAIECYHHPLEDLLRIPFMTLPLALLVGIDAPRLALVSSFIAAWALFNHMDSSFNLGGARRLLVDNHYHRIHHSLRPEHFDKNFAGFFAPWDRLFGTQYLPPPLVEQLPTGLGDIPHPRSLVDYLLSPFQQLLRQWKGSGPAGGKSA